MSTRCNIHFNYGDEIVANIYRHCDGYPEAILPDLNSFFSEVEKSTSDRRFNDPSYLAAKFVVWQANKNARSNYLDFISLGIMNQDAGDGEYVYVVDCSITDSVGRPVVRYK